MDCLIKRSQKVPEIFGGASYSLAYIWFSVQAFCLLSMENIISTKITSISFHERETFYSHYQSLSKRSNEMQYPKPQNASEVKLLLH